MLLRRKRIFIVEDNMSNRTVMEMLLSQEGAETAIERWGASTIKNLRIFAPVDCILLDLMLPGDASGFDIFNDIRALPEFAAVPVVAVSAADPSTAVPRAIKMGFSGFIAKPLNFNEFASLVAAIIEGERIWQT